jgi:hypothetical protein
MFGGAHKVALATHMLPAWTDPDLVDCVISVARRVEQEQRTLALANLRAMLAQGAESRGLVAATSPFGRRCDDPSREYCVRPRSV